MKWSNDRPVTPVADLALAPHALTVDAGLRKYGLLGASFGETGVRPSEHVPTEMSLRDVTTAGSVNRPSIHCGGVQKPEGLACIKLIWL